MRGSGKKIKWKVKEPTTTLMDLSTKENGKAANIMEKAYMSLPTELYTKANGKAMSFMELGATLMPLDVSGKVNLERAFSKANDNLNLSKKKRFKLKSKKFIRK